MSGCLRSTVEAITPVDEAVRDIAARRQDILTKPAGSLGRLESIAVDVAGMMSNPEPDPGPGALVLAAADHGVCEEGISAYPQAVTAQMVRNFLAGGAAINAIAGSVGVTIFPVDAGVAGEPEKDPRLHGRRVAAGTRNFLTQPAMSAERASQTVESGIDFAAWLHGLGFRTLLLGDMGIGNTTSAAAVTALITGNAPDRVTGRGTMIDDETYRRKLRVVREAVSCHAADPADGLAVLAAVGGFESGFLAGCLLGGAARRMPVVLDGFPTTAAALIASAICDAVRRYCIAGHVSQEPGHRLALDSLGLVPLLDLDMRLGEGTGAALGFGIVQAACRCLREMATFAEAMVERRSSG